MKNTKIKNVIRELASDFVNELNSNLHLIILPNGDIVYKDFIVSRTPNNYWGVFNCKTKELVSEFFLKSCALIAAKEYNNLQFSRYQQIKHLDRRYQSHYSDIIVYRHNIKNVADTDTYALILNKLEESEARAKEYQVRISRLFKCTFA